MKLLSPFLFWLFLAHCSARFAQDNSLNNLIAKTLENEHNAQSIPNHFSYTGREVSSRTGHHIWIEKVVEIESGQFRRLISVDGRPLTEQERQAQDRLLTKAVAHANNDSQRQREEQKARAEWEATMRKMPQAFLFTRAGIENGCTKILFQPDPRFSPANYRERFLHVLQGAVFIKESEARICAVGGGRQHRLILLTAFWEKCRKVEVSESFVFNFPAAHGTVPPRVFILMAGRFSSWTSSRTLNIRTMQHKIRTIHDGLNGH